MAHVYSSRIEYKFMEKNHNWEIHTPNVDTKKAAQIHTEGKYNIFWYAVTQNGLKDVALEGIKTKYIKKQIEDGTQSNYILGICHFLNNYPSVTKEMVDKITNTDLLFETALNTGVKEVIEFIKPYIKDTRLKNYKSLLKKYIHQQDVERLMLLCENTTEIDRNDFIKHLVNLNLLSYEKLKEAITNYHIDINEENRYTDYISEKKYFNRSFRGFTKNITQEMFFNNDNKLFEKFIKDFGNTINWDMVFSYYIENNEHQIDLIGLLSIIDSYQDRLNKIEVILDNCNVNEKIINKIFDTIYSPKILVNYHHHDVYEKFFNHPMLNTGKIDFSKMILELLKVEKSSELNMFRKTNLNQDPLLNTLKKVYEIQDAKEHLIGKDIFFNWAVKQKQISKEVGDYLFEIHKEEINSFTESQWNKIPNVVGKYLKEKGIHVPPKTSFWNRLLQIFLKDHETKQEVTIKHYAPIQSIGFNQSLFEQVKDEDIKRLLSMIELNQQQYTLSNTGNMFNDSRHYMNNTLPTMLNKMIENYIYFNIIDEVVAKKQIITQLQILNTKTFDVLNEFLQEKEAKITKDNRVINNVIQSNQKEKSYNGY